MDIATSPQVGGTHRTDCDAQISGVTARRTATRDRVRSARRVPRRPNTRMFHLVFGVARQHAPWSERAECLGGGEARSCDRRRRVQRHRPGRLRDTGGRVRPAMGTIRAISLLAGPPSDCGEARVIADEVPLDQPPSRRIAPGGGTAGRWTGVVRRTGGDHPQSWTRRTRGDRSG